MLNSSEAQSLSIDKGVSRSIEGMFFDDKTSTFRLQVRIATEQRAEKTFLYIKTMNEIEAQDLALTLAVFNFFGKTNTYYLDPAFLSPTKEEIQEVVAETVANKAEKVKKSPTKKAKETVAKVEEPSQEEPVESKSATKSDDSGVEQKASGTKAPVKNFTKYNRTDKSHTAVLSSFLTSLCGDESWKKRPGISQFSIEMVGKDFVDESGELAPSFTELCRNFLGLTDGL